MILTFQRTDFTLRLNANILKVEKSPLFKYICVKRKTGKGSNEFEIKATLPMLINKLKILELFKNDSYGKSTQDIFNNKMVTYIQCI